MVKHTAMITTALITAILVYTVITHLATASGVVVYCDEQPLDGSLQPLNIMFINGRRYLDLGSYMIPLNHSMELGNGIIKLEVVTWTEDLGNCTLLTVRYHVGLERRVVVEYSILIGVVVYTVLLVLEQFLRYNNIMVSNHDTAQTAEPDP